VVFNHLFTLCLFETNRGSIFNFWTGIVFIISLVNFVPEWLNGEFVSFIGYILLTNHYHISVLLKEGCCNYSESSRIFRVYFSNLKRALIWQYQCHKYEEGNFQSPRRFCVIYSLAKSVLQLPFGWSRETSGHPSVFEKILSNSTDTVGEDSMQPSGRKD